MYDNSKENEGGFILNFPILIIISIVVAIVIGYKTKINTGLIAIGFAFLIAVCGMGLRQSALVGMWPTKIFLVILSVSLFFGFAVTNGTLKIIADSIIYVCRKAPFIIPYAIFSIGVVLAGMGAGAYSIIAFLVPLSMAIAEKTGMNRLLATLSAIFGSAVGSGFIISMGGVVVKGLIEENGYADFGSPYAWNYFWTNFLFHLIFLTCVYIACKGYKTQNMDFSKPEKPNREQTINLWLIAGVAATMFVPLIVQLIAPNPVTALMAKEFEITWVAMIGTVLALLFKIGDQKKAIAAIPWNTLILIGGVSILIGVATEAGAVDMLASMIGNVESGALIIVLVTASAGFMSFFSSTMGVVVPTLFPLVPVIAQASGLNPTMLFSAIALGATATGISPFSSAGSLALGTVYDDATRDKLYNQLLIMPFIILIATCGLFLLGVYIR